jgi:hypothetical protein
MIGLKTRSDTRLFFKRKYQMSAMRQLGETSTQVSPNPTSTNPAPARRWWSEPLVHFALLGALLFVIDQRIIENKDDPKTIIVPTAIAQEARSMFKEARKREPNAEELQALVQRWLDNEVLYREGLKMQLDQGDKMIRERVIFKSLMSFEGSLAKPEPDEKTLRAWLETKREKYDLPTRHDFEEAVLEGAATPDTTQQFAQALNKGMPSDVKAGLRVFKGRPRATIVQSYGEEFTKALEISTIDEWRALQTKDGWRVVRLKSTALAVPAQFEAIAHILRADWIDSTMAQLRTDTVRERAKNYKIRYETAPNE